MKSIYVAAFVILILLTLNLCSMAQSSQGRILGTVVDSTGAVVSDAKVTITNTATSVSRTIATTAAGEYIAVSNLGPGLVHGFGRGEGFSEGCQHTGPAGSVA